MTTKHCKQCGELKPHDPSQKYCSKASGFWALLCWDCYKAKARAKAAKAYATPEGQASAKAAMARYYATDEGHAQVNAAALAWTKQHRSTAEGRAKANASSVACAKKYPERHAARGAKRRTATLKRIPPWADLSAIEQIYAEAQKQGLEVDHIYPLQGKLVSGLHVANNLQLLTKSENSSKGNKMPNIA